MILCVADCLNFSFVRTAKFSQLREKEHEESFTVLTFYLFIYIFVLSLIFVWDLCYTSCDLVKLRRFTLNRCVCTSLRGEGRTQCDLMRSI